MVRCASRPSQIGAPSRDFPEWGPATSAREKWKRQQAAQKANATKERRRKEQQEEYWARCAKSLKLSELETLLYRQLCEANQQKTGLRFWTAVGAVYGISWERMSRRKQRRYVVRLRTLQNAVNRKLAAAKSKRRISVIRGLMQLVFDDCWKNRRASRRARSLKRAEQRKARLSQCAEFLRSLFRRRKHPLAKDGWIPATLLDHTAEQAGHPLDRIRRARKLLGLEKRHVGYGIKGEWEVRLPARKTAKT
jgi:hypothetical protein